MVFIPGKENITAAVFHYLLPLSLVMTYRRYDTYGNTLCTGVVTLSNAFKMCILHALDPNLSSEGSPGVGAYLGLGSEVQLRPLDCTVLYCTGQSSGLSCTSEPSPG